MLGVAGVGVPIHTPTPQSRQLKRAREKAMLVIEARHIEQAFQRFEDFADVQFSVDPGIGTELVSEIMEKRFTDPEHLAHSAEATRSLRLSAGISDEAAKAFWRELEALLSQSGFQTARDEREPYVVPAFMGLVVGLIAAQLAAEQG